MSLETESTQNPAVMLHIAFYNFCHPHRTQKGTTPAMAAPPDGPHVSTIAELLRVGDQVYLSPPPLR